MNEDDEQPTWHCLDLAFCYGSAHQSVGEKENIESILTPWVTERHSVKIDGALMKVEPEGLTEPRSDIYVFPVDPRCKMWIRNLYIPGRYFSDFNLSGYENQILTAVKLDDRGDIWMAGKSLFADGSAHRLGKFAFSTMSISSVQCPVFELYDNRGGEILGFDRYGSISVSLQWCLRDLNAKRPKRIVFIKMVIGPTSGGCCHEKGSGDLPLGRIDVGRKVNFHIGPELWARKSGAMYGRQ